MTTKQAGKPTKALKKKTPVKKKSPAKKDPSNQMQEKKTTTNKGNSIYWVGIGASAGGLEALREFVANIPRSATRNQNMTYIVAQHLSPKHQSMLVELINRETEMPVKHVSNGEVPEPNTMYITPPNNDVFVEDGALWLRAPISEISPKPSVDTFFTTLAEHIGDHAIGVILSGTGSDGAHGVRALRAAGGLTVAQEPESAKYDGMPNAAIETRCVDLILKPKAIISEIAALIRSPKHFKLMQEEETSRSSIDELLHMLKLRSSVDFKDYKPGTMYRRIDRRIIACGTRDLDEYLDHVQNNKDELDVLFKDLMISVTSFFRDKEAFEALNKTIQELVESKTENDPIRIWVPGCATGEEAYSIAILLSEHLGGLHKLTSRGNIQIFATDIDTDAMARARKGVYASITVESMDENLRKKYFRHRDMSFEVSKQLRDVIVFSRHNLLEDPPFLRLDLVSCRNLLIYFNSKLQHHVLNLFHYSLLHTGQLFLGKSESLGTSASLFQTLDSKNKIYGRKLVSSKDSSTTIRNAFGGIKKPEIPTIMTAANKAMHDLPDSMIEAFAPDSLLVDENMDIIRIYGDIHAYMQLAAGGVSTNLMSMARKEYRQELRAVIYKVMRENVSNTILPKKLEIQGQLHEINIIIRPLRLKQTSEKLLIVSFEKIKKIKPHPLGRKLSKDAEQGPIIAELEQELTTTREHLQTVVEELETSNEELQSTNEEMQSTNEELQSSNEELETANEELQSTNEELLTVNEELNTKSAELSITNEELNNIKDSIDYPLLVVDKELRLKRYNTAAHKLFLLTANSEGEALTGIETEVEIPDLRKHVQAVIKTGKAFSQQLDDDGVSYFERILPYREESGRIMGAVLTYNNNSEIRRTQRDLEESQARYNLAVEGSNSGIWDWNIQEDKMFWSSVFCEMLHLKKSKKQYRFKDFKKRIHPEDRDDVMAIFDAHLERGFDFNVECRLEKDDGGYIWAAMSGKAEWGNAEKPKRIAGSVNDITERRAAIEELTRSNESLDRFAYVCSHDLKEPVRIIQNFVDVYMLEYGEKLDERAKKYLEQITASSKRIQQMVKDILSYSQLESRSTSYEEVDCNEELPKVLENLSLTIKEVGAIITVEDLPVIRADHVQIFQIFQNLIGNGLKFCRNKKPHIKVSAKDMGEFWEFRVKDNGIGMEQEYASQIFGVFKRLNANDEFPGTGIGLSICQRAVQKHGGKIWVKSSPGKGSSFHFTIYKHLLKRGVTNVYKFEEAS